MALSDRIKKWVQPGQYAGVELVQAEHPMICHLVILEVEKGEVKTVLTKNNIEGFEQLAEQLDGAKIPISLCINSRGIIHKLLPGKIDNESQLLNSVLPNAQADSFSLQTFHNAAGTWGSVIRQESVQQILATFSTQGFWVTDLSIGPFQVQQIWSFVQPKDQLQTSSHQLVFDEAGSIAALDRVAAEAEPQRVSIGEEQRDAILLPAFAAAFNSLLGGSGYLNIPAVAEQKKEYFQKQLFTLGGWALLIGLLGILLLNTFFYYHYKDKNEGLSSQVLYAESQLELLDSLRSQITRQEDFIQRTGINQNSKTSFYADRLAASLPSELQLTQVEVFPMQGSARDYREGDMIRYQKEVIHIEGRCKNSLVYNEWLGKLEQLDWVKRAEHLEYQDLSNKVGAFELQLIIAVLPPSQ